MDFEQLEQMLAGEHIDKADRLIKQECLTTILAFLNTHIKDKHISPFYYGPTITGLTNESEHQIHINISPRSTSTDRRPSDA